MAQARPALAALDDATERFRLLVEHSPDMLSLYDRAGRFTFASASHRRILGWDPDELVGRDPVELIHPDDIERLRTEVGAQLRRVAPLAPVELRFRMPDGRYRYVEVVLVDLTAEPSVGGFLVASRDVSDRKRAEAGMQDQARILERVARGAPLDQTLDELCAMVERGVDRAHAVVLVHCDDGRGLQVAAAPSVPDRVRFALDQVSARPEIRHQLLKGPLAGSVAGMAPPRDTDQLFLDAGLVGWWAAPIFASRGEIVLGSITALLEEEREPDPFERQLLATVGSLAAIALERDDAQARLAHQASHDALTGLPNRDHLITRLRAVIHRPPEGMSAVYFLDLDRFKVFNDSVGHEAGDRILIDVAARLRAALREGDAVARFGGDEFVIVCAGLHDEEEVMAVAQRIIEIVEEPFLHEDQEFVVTASVGVALVDGRAPEALLRDADAAMYQAKDRGRGRVEVFDDALRARVVARLEIERDLRRALDADEFVLHYQPVWSLAHDRFAGFEALVRWQHPTRGTLTPAAFLEVAEDAGLVARIGQVARRGAIHQWVEWRRAHPEWGDFVMGVNLAAAELRDGSLPAQVAALLEETGADPRLLVFEASERILGKDTDAARSVLGQLDAMGFMIALDDFGTGSSPLLHLRRFPIDAVKLDIALVAGIGVNRDDNVLVSSVIELAHRLGLFVVAEGVETAQQLERLRAYGCLFAQGHYFARAVPAADAEAWVERNGLNGRALPPPS